MNETILKHYNLIYKVIRDLHCELKDEEEYLFYGLMGLYNGIKTYDSTKQKESTYYYKCIKYSILSHFRYKTSKKRDVKKNELSINTPVNDTHTIEDTLVSDYNLEEEIIKKEQWDLIVKILTETKDTLWKTYICEFYGINQEPMTYKEIAKKHNINIHAVSSSIIQGVQKLKKKVIKEYEKRNE